MEALVTPTSIWCVRANVVASRGYGTLGLERRSGTKHFRGGAKVWVVDAHFGMADTVTVIGHHRASGRLITLDLRAQFLRDFKAALLYSPAILRRIAERGGTPCGPDEASARERAAMFQSWGQRPPRRLDLGYRIVASDGEAVTLETLEEAAPRRFDLRSELVPENLRAIGTVLMLCSDEDGEVRLIEADRSFDEA
jgi:hypothetical protein